MPSAPGKGSQRPKSPQPVETSSPEPVAGPSSEGASSAVDVPPASKKSTPGTPKRRKRPRNVPGETASSDSLGTSERGPGQRRQRSNERIPNALIPWLESLQRLLGILTSPLVIPLTAAACLAVLLLATHYWVSHVLSSVSLMSALPRLGLAPLHTATSLYCGSIGWGCSSRPRQAKTDVARLARSVSEQATQAHDIFQSISALGDPRMVPGLHFVELWELAIAVSASSNLPSRDVLGESLKELGDMTRDMSDRLVGINAQGVNSFSWTVREFKRIQKTIQRVHEREAHYTTEDVSRQLDDLFARLTKNLDYLLANIQETLPLAGRASHLGGEVLVDLNEERMRLLETKEQTPLWRALLDAHSFKGKQLQRDLNLAEDSIGNLKDARTQLEETRKFLLRYRENVAYFKAGLVGFHLSEHQLAPEHEVEALAEVISDFARAVEQAKVIGHSKQEPDVD